MQKITLLLLAITICGCGSQNGNQVASVPHSDTTYSLSKGAHVMLSDYDTLVTGKGCYLSSTKDECWEDTMPVSCYLVYGQVGRNPDTPVTFVNSYADDKNAFGTQWEYTLKTDLENCYRINVSYPIDTAKIPSAKSGSMAVWIVEQAAYRQIAEKVGIDLARNTTKLFEAGLKPIPAKDILGISKWALESKTGFFATKMPVWYDSIYCSAGVTLEVNVKGVKHPDSTIFCYLVANNDVGTMRWKNRVVKPE